MLSKLAIAFVALGYAVNGTHMLWDPAGWYAAVPGVAASGPLNHHFVRDIGFAYLLSGASGLGALGAWRRAVPWLLASAAWPAAHALLHLAEWLEHGLPAGAALVAEGGGVMVPALLGAVVAVQRWRAAVDPARPLSA